MAIDRDKLLKVLRLTGSDQDGEALAALRMALKMMKGAGLTWESLLSAGADRMTESERHHSRHAAQRAWGAAFAEEMRKRDAAARAQWAAEREATERARQSSQQDHEARRPQDKDPRNNFDLRSEGLEILDATPDLLSEWERGFLTDWRGRSSHRMTDKQREIFIRIIDGIEAKRDARAKGYG